MSMSLDSNTALAKEDWQSAMTQVCDRLRPMAVSGNANFADPHDAAALLWKLRAAIAGSLALDFREAFINIVVDLCNNLRAPVFSAAVKEGIGGGGSGNLVHHPAAAGHAIWEESQQLGGEGAGSVFSTPETHASPPQRGSDKTCSLRSELAGIEGGLKADAPSDMISVRRQDCCHVDMMVNDREDGLPTEVVRLTDGQEHGLKVNSARKDNLRLLAEVMEMKGPTRDSDDGLETTGAVRDSVGDLYMNTVREDAEEDLEAKRVRLLQQLRLAEHSCTVCGNAFRNMSRFKMHMRRKHGDTNFTLAGPSIGRGPVACPERGCSYTTRHKALRPYAALRKHFDRVHGRWQSKQPIGSGLEP